MAKTFRQISDEMTAALGPTIMAAEQKRLMEAMSLMSQGGLITPSNPQGWGAPARQDEVSYWNGTFPSEPMYVSFGEVVPPGRQSRKAAKPVTLTRTALAPAPADPFTETERDVFDRAKSELGYKRPLKPEEKPLHKALVKLAIAPFDRAVVTAYKASKEERGFASSIVWSRKPLDKYEGMVPEFALQRALDIKKECPKAKFHVDALTKVPDPFLVVTLGDEEFFVDVWMEPDFHAKRVW